MNKLTDIERQIQREAMQEAIDQAGSKSKLADLINQYIVGLDRENSATVTHFNVMDWLRKGPSASWVPYISNVTGIAPGRLHPCFALLSINHDRSSRETLNSKLTDEQLLQTGAGL